MGLWTRLMRWRRNAERAKPQPKSSDAPASSNMVELPSEPHVFECQSCGKVFESRRKRAACPECDSTDVSLMSE